MSIVRLSCFLAVLLILGGCISGEADSGKRGDEVVSGKKVLMVIAPGNFRDEELFLTKTALEESGIKVSVASRSKGVFTGSKGGKAEAMLAISEAVAVDYDAIVFVGGSGASTYFDDNSALSLARSAYSAGKIVAAICIAPSILANAGLLKGKKATSFPSEEGNLKAKGAVYTRKPVEVDGRIVTANGPESSREFGKAIAGLLK